MAAIRMIRTLGVATCLAIATCPPLGAHEAADSASDGVRYLGIDGWDLQVSGGSQESDLVAVCSLSTTVLAHPNDGASGGRVTVQFRGAPGHFRLTSTISGGVDTGRPVGIWVDHHLIADQDARSETIQFTEVAAQSVMTLFKAGQLGAVRFHRSGQELTVPISLTGFTRAVHTARQECQS
jgi:hypothetical protein